MKERLIIIDGNSLVNRAFFALPKLTNSKGLYTNAIFGFTKMLQKIVDDYAPQYLVVAFDVKGPTFRHKQYDDYKGTRKGMPDELAMQMEPLKQLLDALGVSRIELPGYEADDLIGTVTQRSSEKGIESIIVSGDKDNLQLVKENVKVAITKKGISEIHMFEREDVFKELGVYPENVIDFKGLSGDSSDNIPGVRGIGAKTAAKLIAQFGTVESIYENIEEVESKRIRGLLETDYEKALISKKLGKIMIDVPVEFSTEEYRFEKLKHENAYDLLINLEMSTLLKSLGFKEQDSRNDHLKQYVIKEQFECGKLIEKIKADSEMTFKTLSIKEDGTHYAILWLAILDGVEVCLTKDFQAFKEVFENPKIKKNGFDLKDDYLALRTNDIVLEGINEDLMISHYLLYPDRNSTDVEKLSLHTLNYEIKSLETLTNKGKLPLDSVEESDLLEYLKNVLLLFDSTRDFFKEKLNESELMKLYEEVEIPLIEVLGNMEYIGFKVDMQVLDEMDLKVSKLITEMETLIYQYAMEEFNINSPKQLGVVLFDKLGLRVIKKTKTGYSTNHDVLMKLRKDHPIVDLVIEYRSYSKLKSTYIDGFRNVINPETNRVHSRFNQTVAVTGRLSSTEPNMQNIPVRLDLGRELRKVFVASNSNHQLVDADYSQIELRILAHLSKDENLLKAYKEGIDIHTLTASQVFDIPIDNITSKERGEAKGVNFGIVYGISDYGLSENLGISRKKARNYIDSYFETYPTVKNYLDQLILDCKDKGYVETIMGRRRTITDINASNFTRRSFAERTAMNTPIQGSAADIIKMAMIKVYRALKDNHLKSQLILQVHDELIIDTLSEEVEQVKKLLKDNMENAIELAIPISVDMNVGDNWYDTK